MTKRAKSVTIELPERVLAKITLLDGAALAALVTPGGEGLVLWRVKKPALLDPERGFAVNGFNENGIFSGDYDLSREEAIRSFTERSRRYVGAALTSALAEIAKEEA